MSTWVPVPRKATDTQLAAAAQAARAQPKRSMAILAALVETGGLTDFELVDLLGISINRVNGARNPLVKKGLARDSGHTRPNHEGNECIVWEPTPAGCRSMS